MRTLTEVVHATQQQLKALTSSPQTIQPLVPPQVHKQIYFLKGTE